MDPEAHRTEREAMLVRHQVIAKRMRRETDEIVAAAAEKRRAFLDRAIARMRAEEAWRLERQRIVSVLLATGPTGSVVAPLSQVAVSAIVSVESKSLADGVFPPVRAATG